MQTLNLASAPATDNQAASILVMDDKGNIFCTVYADGRIKVIGEDAELIAPEMAQISLVQQNFDLFFKNLDVQKIDDVGFKVLDVFYKDLEEETLAFLHGTAGATWKDLKLKEDIFNIHSIMEDENEEFGEEIKNGAIACDLTRVQENCNTYNAAYFRLIYS